MNITGNKYVTEHFHQFNIIKLKDIYLLSAGVFMYQFTTRKLPTIFKDFFISQTETHSCATRNRLIYKIPLYKGRLGLSFIKKAGIEIWIELVNLNRGVVPMTKGLVKHLTIKQIMHSYC